MTRITTEAELVEALKARGWRVTYDETSQPFAELRVGDRVCASLPSKRFQESHFYLAGWVTNDALSVAYTMIFHPRKRRAESMPLVNTPYIEVTKPVASDEDIDEKCAEFVEFARSLDVEECITKLLDKEANGIGDFPARHLAALAATAAVDVLDGYISAFEKGDRLGFVPYIKYEHITAALDFAKKRESQSDWLPRSPKLRV